MGLAADLTFTTNAFYRRFSDDPTLTVAALALPTRVRHFHPVFRSFPGVASI